MCVRRQVSIIRLFVRLQELAAAQQQVATLEAEVRQLRRPTSLEPQAPVTAKNEVKEEL